jgi:hypothetical protein
MKGRSEGLRVLTLLEFVDGFDSNKLFSSCFCDCDCDGVWADCGLCDSTPPEEYLSVCNFLSSIWSIFGFVLSCFWDDSSLFGLLCSNACLMTSLGVSEASWKDAEFIEMLLSLNYFI